ncbi:MAG: OmpA family protein [Kofleriaceae bacterium]|nr:OmpA family protein [Kofleriaceae bacterium]
MKISDFRRWAQLTAVLSAGITLMGVPDAQAQEEGYQLNRLTPAPAGDPFTPVEYPWYSGRLLAGQLTLDYARNSVASAIGSAPIGHSLYGRFGLTTAFFGRVGLSLEVPVLLYEAGDAFNGVGPSGTVLSDPRIGVRVLLWGQPDSAFSLSAAALLWLPIGAEDDHAGDEGLRVLPRLTFGGIGAGGRMRWGLNAGFLVRERARLSTRVSPVGNTVGSEIQLAAGISYLDPAKRFRFGPEASLSFSVDSERPEEQSIELLEVYAAGHYSVSTDIEIGIGVGAAVRGSGLPDARTLFSLRYTPQPAPASKTNISPTPAVDPKEKPPLDRDGDGVLDSADTCPDRPGNASTDPLRNGCPPASEKVILLPDADGHVGAIEVDDGTQIILVDKAYATAEVASDGKARIVARAEAATITRAIASVADILPPADRDGDGILDDSDVCPDRPGQASTNALRNGCPPASEKIVVLPDADGHVGAIEVDDGTSKTLIDTAYGSVEVASDGSLTRLPPAASTLVLDRAVAEMAAMLPVVDADQDGIPDSEDACPTRAGPKSAQPQRSGCPKATETVVILPNEDGTVGSLEVDDGTNKIVLDKAFATVEVGSDGQVRSVASESEAFVLRSLEALSKNLPKADSDGDGIVDSNDACKSRKGKSNSDPARHGCPIAVETIVLLADEDGHVGSLEIGEGSDRIILDQANTTADIGADGVAIKVDSAQRDVDKQFREVFAVAQAAKKVLPKSAGRVQFIVYFDEKAVPTRDVDKQIEDLLQELQGKKDYRIEVVGHTDATGSRRANFRVGSARAAEIASRLRAGGIPAKQVSSSTRGSSEPAVEVINSKVPEPLNRRVEIRIKKISDPHIIVLFGNRAKTARSMKSDFKSLANQLKGQSDYTIWVVGHSDGAEDEALALKRANEVVRQLRRQRIPKARIQSSSKGASEPAVEPGESKVPQPLNRRVEIYIK